MTRHLMLVALLAGCNLPADPPTPAIAEFMDRAERQRAAPERPVESPEAPTQPKPQEPASEAVSVPVVAIDKHPRRHWRDEGDDENRRERKGRDHD